MEFVNFRASLTDKCNISRFSFHQYSVSIRLGSELHQIDPFIAHIHIFVQVQPRSEPEVIQLVGRNFKYNFFS